MRRAGEGGREGRQSKQGVLWKKPHYKLRLTSPSEMSHSSPPASHQGNNGSGAEEEGEGAGEGAEGWEEGRDGATNEEATRRRAGR